MKNAMKITVGVVAMLFCLNGFCFGQEDPVHPILKVKMSDYNKSINNINKEAEQWKTLNNQYTKDAEGDWQEVVNLERSRSLKFENESNKTEITINSTDEYNFLGIKVYTAVYSGNIVVDIVDPKGKNQGSFTVKAEDTPLTGSNTKSIDWGVSGQMQKTYRSPMKGDWIIRATPSSASGTMKFRIYQRLETNIDKPETNNVEVKIP